MSNYIIELAIIHLALILGYWCFLRNEQQYVKMRLYLIGTSLLALFIPLLKLPKLFISQTEVAAEVPVAYIPMGAMTPTSGTDPFFWSFEFLIWIYLAISGFFLLRFIGNIISLISLDRQSSYEKMNDIYVRKVNGIRGSFTFFNWIFISNEIDRNQPAYEAILNHERAHAQLGHSYDLLFFELFKVVFWWLPTSWYIRKEIKKIHEYQADAYALQSCDAYQYSTILISSTLKLNGLALASSFHDGLILQRLKAMKQQVTNINPWKFGVLAALGTLLIVVFACSEDPAQSIADSKNMTDETYMVVEQLPEYKGGMDAFYKYIGSEIKYPKEARTSNVEGKVHVEFVVEKDGSLSEVKVVKGIGSGCDEEAVRVVQNATGFEPGKQHGRAVRFRMVIPIQFKVNQELKNPDDTPGGMIILDEVQHVHQNLKVDANYNNGIWSGIVYDEEGQPLPGATILVYGSTLGTISDLDGKFQLKAKESVNLKFSFVGYETLVVEGNKDDLPLQL